jgi:penicillin amidase
VPNHTLNRSSSHTTIKGWLLLDQADNWDGFVEAMRLIEAPQLNVAYADVVGNVGYWVTGKVPVRASGQGMIPAPAWTGECEWVGEVPFEEMPHALNPDQGYVVTCNHRIVPDDYPHFLGSVWRNGYRARRIVDIIQSKDKLSSEDFRALQVDFTCIPGQEFVERLEGLSTKDRDVQAALDTLRSWDGQLTATSTGGTLYEVTRYTLVRNLLEPGLGKDLTARLMGQGFHPLLLSTHELHGHDTVSMLRMLDNPNSWWVSQAGGREAVLTRSLKQAVQWLREELGQDVNDWEWGKIHRVIFPHAMGMKKPLDRVFNRGPLPIGGDTDTPCATAMIPNDPYDSKAWAPSFRQIVDLSDLSRSLVIHPPGQSGQLGSPHYDDLAALWIKGEYHSMLWTRQQVEQEAEGKLTLNP